MKENLNENIIHVKNGDVEYIQFKKLLEYSDILAHCFTIKPLDFSGNDNYESKKDIVNSNYKKICDLLELDYKNIVRPYQTHTNTVKTLTEEIGIFPKELTNIDGLITDKPNKILSLTYADCTPIYLFDYNKKVIGNIHSGWKGTVARIVKNAIEEMIQKHSCNPKNIICAIGPTIRKCHFEVEEDVENLFFNEFKTLENIDDIIEFKGTINDKNKYMIDTVEINKQVMKSMGILEENILDSKLCTVCNSDKFHSYRVDKELSGRNTALICLKNM